MIQPNHTSEFKRNQAARTIQRAFKRHLDRKGLRYGSASFDTKRARLSQLDAATRIQAAVRGHQARQRLKAVNAAAIDREGTFPILRKSQIVDTQVSQNTTQTSLDRPMLKTKDTIEEANEAINGSDRSDTMADTASEPTAVTASRKQAESSTTRASQPSSSTSPLKAQTRQKSVLKPRGSKKVGSGRKVQISPDSTLVSSAKSDTARVASNSTGPHPTSPQRKRSPKKFKPKLQRKGTLAGTMYSETKLKTHAKISVYINGEAALPSRLIQLDPKRVPTYERMLDYLNDNVSTKFGPIIRLARADDYVFITGYDGIHDGGQYIAVGRSALQKLDYTAISTYRERDQRVARQQTKPLFDARAIESRVLQLPERAKVLQCLPSGDEDGVPIRVVTTKLSWESWEKMLELLTEKCGEKLLSKAVDKVFTLDGVEISSLSDLDESTFYVVAHSLPVHLPPFYVQDGKLVRKPSQKVVPVLPKIAVKPKERKLVAAFGRTGAGIMADRPLPNPDLSAPTSPSKMQLSVASTIPRKIKPKQAASSAPGRQGVPISEVRVHQNHAVDGTEERPWYKVATHKQALDAVDQLVLQLQQAEQMNEHLLDDVLVAMQRRVRERIFEHRMQSPDITTAFDERIQEVLDFMMQTRGEEDADRSPEAMMDRFGTMIEAAISGRLAHWESTPSSLVALCILLDQFPRRLHAGTRAMYKGDEMARAVVLRSIFNTTVLDEVHPVYRLFPCLVLSRQEDKELQRLALTEWQRACEFFEADDPIREYTASFKSNYDVIQKLGRFPDRNAILGRKPTKADLKHMEDCP
eukprot:TRINITY_DN7462_c0_g1_i3.p1 TRINITY_DN7462_c0_g1~~TRINITY_DN7462_c0_g1_i3.p1  ORF type:complete len:810 (+),score=180.93 TRINITY_DN7462_c0_g1_i3:141-2570(+)